MLYLYSRHVFIAWCLIHRRDITPDLQGYAGQCTLGSLAPRLLSQCSLGSPASFLPRHDPIPALAYYLLAHLDRPSIDFPCGLFSLPPSLFLYSWVFSTGDSVCSHLLTLVPRSQIFLPWRWWRYVPPKRRFTQDLHGATFQKIVFIFIFTICKVHYQEREINSSFHVTPLTDKIKTFT
jgi:hypothetical protein